MPVTINGTTGIEPLIQNGNNISAVNSLGFRNRIINGDMRIDQRNAGTSVTPTNTSGSTYTTDRFYARISQASKLSYQRSTVAPTGFTNSLALTSLSAYSVGVSDHFATTQAVEGFNVSDLNWGTASAQTITLSFWVRSSLTGTFGGSVANASVNRCFVFGYTISVVNTWEQKTVTIPGDTSGTWLTDNGAGLFLNFSVGAGSSTTAAANSWSDTFSRSVTGQTSLVGTNGATFYITGVQLEAGTVATPFERRDYGREVMMCQRYCQMISSAEGNGTYLRYAFGECTSTIGANGNVNLFTKMRITPSLTTASASLYAVFSAGVISGASTVTLGADGSSPCVANIGIATSGLTAGRGAAILSSNNNTSYLLLTAEL